MKQEERPNTPTAVTWFYQADEPFVLGHFVLPALGLTSCHLQLLLNPLKQSRFWIWQHTAVIEEPNNDWPLPISPVFSVSPHSHSEQQEPQRPQTQVRRLGFRAVECHTEDLIRTDYR